MRWSIGSAAGARASASPWWRPATRAWSELHRLHQTIASALEGVGLGGSTGAFNPHVTLLRDPATVAESFIDPVAWTVQEVQLVFSLVEARRHLVLRRWRLRG